MVIKAVIFDIGGVVVGSPLTGIRIYEAALSPPLPPDYINASITDLGSTGAFQQLEKGEIGYHEFIKRFGEELGQVERGNKAYRRLCQKRGTECPKLPEKVVIDGAKLWQEMMSQATYPSEPILTAINHLRRNPALKLAALTNNFTPPSSSPSPSPAAPPPHQIRPRHLPMSPKELHAGFDREREGSSASTGAPVEELKSLFDVFAESALLGMRKPDPRIYEYTLKQLGVEAHEAVFLDDIGLNLISAKKLGIHTVQVKPNQAEKAVKELEKLVRMDLSAKINYRDEKL